MAGKNISPHQQTEAVIIIDIILKSALSKVSAAVSPFLIFSSSAIKTIQHQINEEDCVILSFYVAPAEGLKVVKGDPTLAIWCAKMSVQLCFIRGQ